MEFYIPRYFIAPDNHYFILGPGGTGKSTYLKNQYPDSLHIDLAKPEIFRKYSARPDRFINMIKDHSNRKIIIIEKIQKVPELLTSIIKSMNKNKKQKYKTKNKNTKIVIRKLKSKN